MGSSALQALCYFPLSLYLCQFTKTTEFNCRFPDSFCLLFEEFVDVDSSTQICDIKEVQDEIPDENVINMCSDWLYEIEQCKVFKKEAFEAFKKLRNYFNHETPNEATQLGNDILRTSFGAKNKLEFRHIYDTINKYCFYCYKIQNIHITQSLFY